MAQNNSCLSKRLAMAAALCPVAKTFGDIGCDHGYLGIHLINSGCAKRVIATDINPLPLKSAMDNIAFYNLSDVIETRLSDGMSNFCENEIDCAVICGMGGRLMAQIIKNASIKKVLPPVLICQPQSDYYFFRKFLYGGGYTIEDEDMVKEDGKFYLALRISTAPLDLNLDYNTPMDIELRYGHILINKKHPIFISFLKKELKRMEDILITLDIKSEKAQKARKGILFEKGVIMSVFEMMVL